MTWLPVFTGSCTWGFGDQRQLAQGASDINDKMTPAGPDTRVFSTSACERERESERDRERAGERHVRIYMEAPGFRQLS